MKKGNIDKFQRLMKRTRKDFLAHITKNKEIKVPKRHLNSCIEKITEFVVKYFGQKIDLKFENELKTMVSDVFEKGVGEADIYLIIDEYERYIENKIEKFYREKSEKDKAKKSVDDIFFKIKIAIIKFWEEKCRLLTGELNERVEKSKKKKREEAVYIERLEKSREATLNILEDLRENILELEKLDMMKSEFIDVISHQLRTPLSSIRWNLELLLGGDLGKIESEKQKTSISLSLQSIFILIDILEDTIAALNVERERKPIIRKVPVSLSNIISMIFKEKEEMIDKNNIKVQYKSEEKDLDVVYADYNLLKRILEILITNAIQYSRKEGRVDVALKKIMKEGKEYVRLSISDQGIGIPKEQQERIFQKFFRAKNAPTHAPNGLGLGLFLVKNYTKAHEGSVSFESREGKGTTFYLDLPMNNYKKNEK